MPSGQRNTYQNPKEDNISFIRFDGREKAEQKGGGLHIHSFFFAAAAAGKFVVLGKSLYRVRELFEREESFFSAEWWWSDAAFDYLVLSLVFCTRAWDDIIHVQVPVGERIFEWLQVAQEIVGGFRLRTPPTLQFGWTTYSGERERECNWQYNYCGDVEPAISSPDAFRKSSAQVFTIEPWRTTLLLSLELQQTGIERSSMWRFPVSEWNKLCFRSVPKICSEKRGAFDASIMLEFRTEEVRYGPRSGTTWSRRCVIAELNE